MMEEQIPMTNAPTNTTKAAKTTRMTQYGAPYVRDQAERHARALQMVEWRMQGYSLKQIGEALGIAESTVCLELKRVQAALQPRQPSLPPLPKYERAS